VFLLGVGMIYQYLKQKYNQVFVIQQYFMKT